MKKALVLGSILATGLLARCERAPEFPEVLMTYRDVDWLKANEDQIPVIVAECDKIMNSELRQSDLPIPVAQNCGGIKTSIALIERARKQDAQIERARAAAGM